MAIQWFPGHMHATRQALHKRLPQIDVVIELLDARLPGSSSNPLLAELAADKPALKLLNKQDLADPVATELWLQHFNAQPQTRAIPMDAKQLARGGVQQLLEACRGLAPMRGGMVKPLRLLVCGVPNVGKSTLVNTLLGRRAAKTGDEPGITKEEQRLAMASDVYLFDTPGMLWPRISVVQSGYHLAAAGCVGRNAVDEVEVALELLLRVLPDYEAALLARYGPVETDADADADTEVTEQAAAVAAAADPQVARAQRLLAHIGRRRGALRAGGRIDLQKAAELALNDFRGGAWGRITLETPAVFEQWQGQGRAREVLRQQRKDRRTAKQVPQRQTQTGEPASNQG